MKAKQDKTEARYTPNGTKAEHCAICRNFIAPKVCRVVQGAVVPGGWCKNFERKS